MLRCEQCWGHHTVLIVVRNGLTLPLANTTRSLLPHHHAYAHSKHHGAILVEVAYREMQRELIRTKAPAAEVT